MPSHLQLRLVGLQAILKGIAFFIGKPICIGRYKAMNPAKQKGKMVKAMTSAQLVESREEAQKCIKKYEKAYCKLYCKSAK